MKNKATHSGTCQCCGSIQKLPSGVLAKHGYTVDWGFFSGTCQGAGHKSFEESCDLIKTFIANAQQQLDSVLAEQKQLRKPTTEAKAWVNHYHTPGYGRGQKGGYRWHQVKVIAKTTTLADGFQFTRFYYELEGTEHKIETYNGEKTVADVATYQNARRADAMQKMVDDLERYIKWQNERVANWKPGKLIEVAA